MNLDLPKILVLGAIGACVLFLLLARAVDGPPAETPSEATDETTATTSPDGLAAPEPEPSSTQRTSSDEPSATSDPTAGAGDDAPEFPDRKGEPNRSAAAREPSDDDDDDVEPQPRTIWPADRDGVQGAVTEAMPELEECYDQWLKMEPELAGNIRVQFAITKSDEDDEDAPKAEDGTDLATIPELELVSDVEHPFMEGCVADVMGDLWFDPPPDGRLEVTYPFVFRPTE